MSDIANPGMPVGGLSNSEGPSTSATLPLLPTVPINEVLNLGPQLSERQIHQSYEDAIKYGIMTRDQANDHLRIGHGMGALPDSRSENFYSKTFPAAQEKDFIGGYLPDNLSPDDPAFALKSSINQVPSILAAAKFDRSSGDSLFNTVSSESVAISRMSPTERFNWTHDQTAQLKNVWGGNYLENCKVVSQFISGLETKKPGVFDFLVKSGLSDSASVISQLHAQATLQNLKQGI